MDRQLKNFRHKNKQIMEVLEKIRVNGLTTPTAQKIYHENIDNIIAHFAEEEREIHPMILKAVSDDLYLTKTVNYFIAKADETNRVVHNFFAKYHHEGGGLKYAEEFGVLFAALLQRVRLEDHALYNIYEERQQELASRLVKRA